MFPAPIQGLFQCLLLLELMQRRTVLFFFFQCFVFRFFIWMFGFFFHYMLFKNIFSQIRVVPQEGNFSGIADTDLKVGGIHDILFLYSSVKSWVIKCMRQRNYVLILCQF